MKQLDIGCGSEPAFKNNGREGYEHFGVDINSFDHVKQADLAIEPIPYESDEFDLVTAYDFLEHIPSFVYLPVIEFSKYEGDYRQITSTFDKRNCMVELFNEVYRVLKNGGEFYFETPVAGTQGYWQDPTHVFGWTAETLHYFTGDYYGFHDDLGHTSKFELLYHNSDNDRLKARIKAVKPAEIPYEVGSII
jgi:SAM-dependent methyltransferase